MIVGASIILMFALCALPLRGEDNAEQILPEQQAERLFVEKIQPLLTSKCLGCHGEGDELESNFDMRTREGLLKGGDLGPGLVPQDVEKSAIYQAVLRTGDLVMPPKERNALTKEEQNALRQWIAAGAPWSTPAAKEWGSYDPKDLWAFQPVKKAAPPSIEGVHVDNPIDAFINSKLADKKLTPAPAADKRTFIRRATYDLTGLPPTPAAIEEFVGDESPGAVRRLIDRLLASPQYGEQWGQRWLDVARYADTAGFANDYERPNAWRYRDYVIRSFNQDKPFDRFVIEQIAGDELYDLEMEKNPELLIAAGYLRMGPWEHTGMSVEAITRQAFLDDVTNAVGVTFLAMGLRCARCHDHKFDPIPTLDYYRIQAVFAPTYFADRPADHLPRENVAGFAAGRRRAERLIDESRDYLSEINRKHDDAVKQFLQERGLADVKELPADERPKRHFGLEPVELGLQKIFNKRRDYFVRELKRFEPYAFSTYSGPSNDYKSNSVYNKLPADKPNAKPDEVFVLVGGSLASPSQPAPPGVLSAAQQFDDESPDNPIPDSTKGRRLALARWIASPENPLTARVIVNRIWQHHFGRGIAQNPNNFGKMGKHPTHPELLDYLAARFIEDGWSIKQLHRLIMTSAAYQRSGRPIDVEVQQQVDPANDFLSYFPPRRLTAEELRDSMLAASGELNHEIGGPGVYPEINWEVALQPRHIMGSVAPAYQPSPEPDQRNRRSIYAFRYRTLADPMLEVFNQPGSETSCEQRDETTIAPQAFSLFNGRNTHSRALALAARISSEHNHDERRVRAAFRSALGRAPSDDELRSSLRHVREMTEHHQTHEPAAPSLPRKVSRLMVEELTGEEYQWDEELDVMADYTPDLSPIDVDARIRALAELCLVLLNSNEFIYVY